MLNNTIKTQIDSARDILVGKVPDPKAQVEQITTALIYKFMDDMDKESQELGGKTKFFMNDYAKYSWTKIMDVKLSGQERMNLYVEAMVNIPKNPDIPQLFRDIFKGAFLPFRDPRTLTLFLKEINKFNYDNSENLGNSFEYLLSILGSQGDAGQFRTPRHIIDFIVQVVNPKKNESILDPACGTSGFLISAYKHIIKHNSPHSRSKKIKNYGGGLLTPEEKIKLTQNIVGYDISPDMIKLALVNLYLHGFSDPKIFEYDTLTSDKRWDDDFNVILANPPFMTPKGGISPHNRFSVQANRAEVLFVDYIAEHLGFRGRAGIIVPEGIVFQAANAYKSLRKNLIENWGLYAVVSLPSGVFQPYSGVKTSILFLDKTLAKKANDILFLKAERDGFDLGAQRREIDNNDLPSCLLALNQWKKKQTVDKDNKFAFAVTKEKIAENGEYNLTGDRYREVVDYSQMKWPMVELGEVLEYEQPTNYIVESVNYKDEYKTPVLTAGKSFLLGYTNEENGIFLKENLPVIIFDDFTTATKLVNFQFKVKSSAMKILKANENINIRFVFYMIQRIKFDASQHKRYWISQYSKIKIALPPLEVQEQIVAEIEQYQKVLDGAKQVVETWKPNFYINPKWEMVELGKVCDTTSGGTPKRDIEDYWNGDIPWLGSAICKDKKAYESKEFITKLGLNKSSAKLLKKNTTLIALVGATIGKTALLKFESTINQNIAGVYTSDNKKLHPLYLFYVCQTLYKEFTNLGKFKMANLNFVKTRKIPLPPLDVQEQIVAEIEAEQKSVEECKKLVITMEKKIKAKIEEVWRDVE